jgi:ATP/maltotriose-dependent transcriptional regulator MalT
VPASFAGLVQSRLDALDPTVRTVVDAAAVVGRTVDWHLLTTMTGLTESTLLDALRVAVDRGLLAYDGGDADTFRFVHALTREAVVERLLPPQRTALARRAAEAVETDGTDLVLAADLHAQAGDPHRAAALLLRAAAAEAALGTSAELLRRARSLDPADSDAALGLVEVLALSGQAAEARELGDELLARLPAGDARRGRLALTLARACLVAAQAEDGEGYLAQAEPGEAAAALGAHLAFQLHRPDDAERLALAATEATDPAVRCEAFEMIGRVARLRGQPHAAEAAFSRALTVAEEHALPLWRVRALHELGTLDLLGPARADRLELARDLAVQTGGLWTAAVLDLQLMACHALVMDHAATLETARRGIELAESLRLPVLAGAGLVFVAIAQAHLGETEAMHATLDEAAGRLRVDDVDQYAAVLFVRGTPALLEHDLPALRTSLQQGMEVLRRNPSASPSPYRGLHALVETVLGDGEAEREELRASGATVQAANAGTLAYADAVAGGRAGRDPAPHVAAADRVLAPLVWRRHHARLLVAPAALRDGWGSPVEWLREALAHFESTGDLGLVRACREQLRVAGAPVPRKGRGDSAVPPHLRRLGVTSREMDVLSLVAGGLPTSAIAERLFLSPRTVETHVANLLSKTGAAGRAELANYVAGDR